MTERHRPGERPLSDTWVTAIHQAADAARPLGSGVLIDARRVLTCAHVVHSSGQVRGDLWIAFPKAEELMHLRLRVEQVVAPPVALQEVQDVAVLVLEEEVALEYAARLRRPAAGDLVDSSWWSFGFPDGVLGNSAAGSVGEALGYGWVRLDTESRYPVQPGYSGAALWSADYEAVVGLVGQARSGSGDARALTLRAIDSVLPHEKLRLLTDWSVEAAGDAALSSWGWTLAGDAESGRHWRPRARGVSTDAERGFRFRGRSAALSAVVDWMTAQVPDRRQVLLVTGSPGVGKSAVLGRVVTTADAQIAAALPAEDRAVRAPVGSVACAVHARDKTAVEVAREIATAASAPLPEVAKGLPDLLRETLAADARGSFCVVIDALDEATAPEQARQILQMAIALAETCADLDVRVVVGSRRVDDAGDLLAPFESALHVIDLDRPEFFAQEDLVAYALATLQLVGDERADSPYNDAQIATTVAERIAGMAQGNFLIAGLVARSHGMHDRDAVAVEQLRYTATVEAALRDYLSRLPSLQGVSAEDLLTALAYAESPGLTLVLWRWVVHAMTGRWVDEHQLYGFARSAAANFLVESSGATSLAGSFRLFHQALNEALLSHRATSATSVHDERVIARALMRAAGSQWATAPSYLLRSLPGHAARGGIIDELLNDDAYPLHADLRRLVPAAKASLSTTGRARARLLRKTPQALEAGPRERIALFTVTEAREQLGRSYRDRHGPAPYRAVWAVGAPHAEDIVLEGHTAWINALCPVPVGDRTLLASASNDHTIRLWDVDTGEPLRVLAGHTGPVRALACLTDSDQTLLASADTDHTIRLWDVTTGHSMRAFGVHAAYINALCPVPVGDRTLLASASNDHTIRLWDVDAGEPLHVLTGHTGPVRALACLTDSDQTLLASAGTDRTIRLWDPASGRGVQILDTGTAWINALCPVAVGQQTLLATAGNDQVIRLWDPQKGSIVHTIAQHTDWVRALTSFPVGGRTLVASGGHDTAVRLWDSRSCQIVHGFDGHTDWVTSICVLAGAEHTLLASAGNDSAIRLWDAQAGPPMPAVDQVGAVTAVCAIPNDAHPLLASAENNDLVRVRDVTTGAVVTVLEDRVRSMCALDIGSQPHLATGSDDFRIRVWNPASGKLLRTLTGHDDTVTALCPVTVLGRTLLASASNDHTIRLWDPATQGRYETQVPWESPVLAMDTIMVNGQQLLAVGLEDGSIGLWDAHRQHRRNVWEGHAEAVTALTAVHAQGQTLLASAGDDRTIQLWDPRTGEPIHRFNGHTDKITTLVTVTLGQRTQLASASDDRTVRVWDPQGQRAVMTVAVHSPAGAIADCGDLVVVGLTDGLLALSLE
ncbi:trypsin-like peptidase domain-containing protein [Streptomyces sp. NPDC086766]|uniref:trypsin-like peptidase domain-containing protein n=1 Tax=Streptomyces sp. NPDC086766 TaxID=3365754 RepID=UPI0038105953